MKVRNKKNGVVMDILPSAYHANPRNWEVIHEQPKKQETKQEEKKEDVEPAVKDKKDWLLEQLDRIDPDHGMNKRHGEETLSEKLHELKTKDKK